MYYGIQSEESISKDPDTGKTGYLSETRIYECSDCSGCPYLGKCYKGKYNKRIQVSPKFDEYRRESERNSERNITSEEGILLRINRSIQAEGVFGITKQDMGFTRFLTRGAGMVKTEYLLLSLGFNINKLHNRIQNDRFGSHLLIQKTWGKLLRQKSENEIDVPVFRIRFFRKYRSQHRDCWYHENLGISSIIKAGPQETKYSPFETPPFGLCSFK